MADGDGAEVTLRMTAGQARAVDAALDLYVRLCIGQVEEVAGLVRDGTLPVRADGRRPRAVAAPDLMDRFRDAIDAAKALLGYGPSSSNGIGHPHVHPDAHRAYEVHKVLARALAEHRDPAPSFRGVDYDGLIVRYTADPAPAATVATGR